MVKAIKESWAKEPEAKALASAAVAQNLAVERPLVYVAPSAVRVKVALHTVQTPPVFPVVQLALAKAKHDPSLLKTKPSLHNEQTPTVAQVLQLVSVQAEQAFPPPNAAELVTKA